MTTPLDPLRATDRIHAEYRRYLRSTFPLSRRDLRRAFEEQLDGRFELARGPILQASAPYVAGATIRELVGEGVLADRFLRFTPEQFPIDRPLYLHQEQAIRRAVSGRNLVVATGTGSGKTECFLIPILNALFREAEEGTLGRPGVRALLLYPMNALANDQLKRLRGLLAGFESITFGRYVGETKRDEQSAEQDFRIRYPHEPRLRNELISREVMQDRPPHLLLTNYAMLEYLLLRPDDSSLFDGVTGEHWRFLALDEVHVYAGAQGSEVAMLLRRVRDRVVSSRPGALQCFGTSATLGRGEQDYPGLVEFAKSLFAEPFEWDDSDEARQDVVGATRRPLARESGRGRRSPDELAALRAAARNGSDPKHIARLAGVDAPEASDTAALLARVLANDERMVELQQRLERGSVDLRHVAQELFPDASTPAESLVDLVDLGVLARDRADDAPLLPGRYHFFLRALEGAFVCLHPEHDAREPGVLLARHADCPSCRRHGRDAAMFELGVCRRCGSEYLVGSRAEHKLAHAAPTSLNPIRLLLGEPLSGDEDDEDEEVVLHADDRAVPATLCAACGHLAGDGAPGCGCAVAAIRVWLAQSSKEDGVLRRCIACGSRAGGDPVYRFLTGLDAPVSVVATDLYQEIPASTDDELQDEVGQGRKLLTFSDSRQDAAFFAPFLENTYRRAVQRRLIAQAAAAFDDEHPRLEDVAEKLVKLAERARVLDPDDGRTTNRREARTWLMREVLALDRRQSLEGTGVADIRLAFPRQATAPKPLLELGFTESEALDLVRQLLDTVRGSGAVEMLDGVDVRGEAFAPRNREISVREAGPGTGIIAWSAAKNLNGRLDLLQRIFAAREIAPDPRTVLSGLWRMLAAPQAPWRKLLVEAAHSSGPVYRLNPEWFEIVVDGDTPIQRCDSCRQLWWRAVAGVCPSFRCRGTVATVEDRSEVDDEHYARLYRQLDAIGMSVQEHTAQWTSMKASAIQDDFVRGRVNVLSCSTTFELGVDVGDVQAVLLRNVPPSPANYIQRAGRAGRRTDSAALVVTYAQRRSHDLTYFEQPHRMVDGTIPAPRVVLDNVPIVRRHVHSMAFAAYQREVGAFKDVADFFTAGDDAIASSEAFVDWLRTGPGDLGEAIGRVVPKSLLEALGVSDWEWVEALVTPTETEPTFGWLARAKEEVDGDVKTLQRLIDEASEASKFQLAHRFSRVLEGLMKRFLLGFLASRNILPKYGFPVDVVELSLAASGDADAANLELTRDLKLAISDYAPGSVTVAGKKQWRSLGLVRRGDRELPNYAWVKCQTCQRFRHGLVEVASECPSCGSTAQGEKGTFVMPVYGFAGSRHEGSGETRPRRLSFSESFFGSYRHEPPTFEDVPGASLKLGFSRQGRITLVNKGPQGRGFRICEWCGFGQPVAGSRIPKTHTRVDRPGQQCNGRFEHLQLGHEFYTDVIELQVTQDVDPDMAISALYALLEAAPALHVARDDIDGTVHLTAPQRPSLVLFDTVPGGAGHVQRLAQELPTLLRAAHERVETCECGEETSCYTCLRSYGNQFVHERLSRRDAIAVLMAVASAVVAP